MARYLVIGSLSAQGSAGLIEQGATERQKQFTAMIEELGASVVGYWFNDQGQSIVMLEQEEPMLRAAGALMSKASGAWDSLTTMELFDAAEFDAQLAAQMYVPPGR